ncbi:MAG: undecaprenyl-diphosphate phosphatase [Planctomycetota bacterium]
MAIPEWLSIALLGIIEGVTEFLPISSTGHLLLAERWLPRQSDLFNIVIQSGAVLAVIPLFWARIRQFACQLREREPRELFLKVIAAFGLTGAGGLVLDKLEFELPETVLPVAVALLAGGVIFICVERLLRGRQLSSNITWTVALAAGLGQLVAAVFPGASRSGTTILIMLVLGLNRPLATEFSFLIGIPTMLAAGGLKIANAVLNPGSGAPPENWLLVVLGFVVSAAVSFIVVKWLLRYVQTHTFTVFGWYRIVLALVLLAWVA